MNEAPLAEQLRAIGGAVLLIAAAVVVWAIGRRAVKLIQELRGKGGL